MREPPSDLRLQIGGNYPPMTSADRQFYRNINGLLPPHEVRMFVAAMTEVDAAKQALQKLFD